jgi:hypothetical protein
VFSWNFRDLWSGVNGYLRDDLEQVEATVQARWFAQHGDDGAHTQITADYIVASAAHALRLGLSATVDPQTAVDVSGTWTIKVVKPPSPTAIVSVIPSTVDDVTLWSLSTAGRSMGEIVLLRAAYDYGLTHFGFVLRSNSSTTPPSDAAKFLTFGDGTGTNYDALTLGVSETAILRLESCQPTPTAAFGTYWRTLGKLSV